MRISKRTWRIAALVGLVAVIGLTVTNALSNPGKKSPSQRQAVTVLPPRLVETVGASTPLGDYGKEQSAASGYSGAVADTNSYSDWAGFFPEGGKLKIFWKNGNVPTNLRPDLERISQIVPIEIYAAKYSKKELADALNAIDFMKLGVCSGDAPYGVDAIQLNSDKDLKTLNVPATTPSRIPIVLTQSPCPEAT